MHRWVLIGLLGVLSVLPLPSRAQETVTVRGVKGL